MVALADALAFFSDADVTTEVVATRPTPLVVATLPAELDVDKLELACLMLQAPTGAALWRAVAFDRLPTVLASGVDVEPSDAHISAGDIGKALEYGGRIKWGDRDPTVILGFMRQGLDRTFRKVSSSLDQDELSDLKKTFPNVSPSEDGETLLLSRMPNTIPFAYEFAYGYWIPEDPFETLKVVLVLGQRGSRISGATRAAITACSAVAWR